AVAEKSVTADMKRMTRRVRPVRRGDMVRVEEEMYTIVHTTAVDERFRCTNGREIPGRSHGALVAALLGAVDTPAPGVARLAVVVGAVRPVPLDLPPVVLAAEVDHVAGERPRALV